MTRGQWLSMLVVGAIAAGCGDTQEDRAASGGLSGAATGALIGGPIGLLVGGGLGYVAGANMDKSADEKIEELARQPPPDAPPPSPARPKPPEPSGAADAGKMLNPAQIEDKVNAAGYKPVHDLRRQGPAYVARGEREGTLYAVRIDAATGRLLASREIGTVPRKGNGAAAAIMTEQQVRSALRRGGYEMVGDVERSGGRYRVEAMQNGMVYDLVVDGRTGEVVSSTPSTASGAPPQQGG